MRIWSLHPAYLDRQALVACWRETLLAQKVLTGGTTGYTRHPQLERFRAAADPAGAVAAHLAGVRAEALERGYRFDETRITVVPDPTPIPVTTGQLAFEAAHLRAKIEARSPEWAAVLRTRGLDLTTDLRPHPLFTPVDGPVEPWERGPHPGT